MSISQENAWLQEFFLIVFLLDDEFLTYRSLYDIMELFHFDK
jgi:hypothetical protein